MSLFVVSTPIGHPKDITLRALDILKESDLVIGEERSEVSRFLKSLGLSEKPFELLNEHSRPEDVSALAESCKTKRVALVSDCGTPGFCDPGADLVSACRRQGVAVTAIPGASSLMALLSVSGRRLRDFVFVGFLPPDAESRTEAVQKLAREPRPCFVMDTPYRLAKTMRELAAAMPSREAVLGLDLTQETELVLDGTLKDLADQVTERKAEFVLMIGPAEGAVGSSERFAHRRPRDARGFKPREGRRPFGRAHKPARRNKDRR
ncbi:MAG TPA: SAM-dependent methyltransferase [Bdellovibrionales bacterium]|nr:SAM-dependent methyltransferase [Bdellovibrionales bacterium]